MLARHIPVPLRAALLSTALLAASIASARLQGDPLREAGFSRVKLDVRTGERSTQIKEEAAFSDTLWPVEEGQIHVG